MQMDAIHRAQRRVHWRHAATASRTAAGIDDEHWELWREWIPSLCKDDILLDQVVLV